MIQVEGIFSGGGDAPNLQSKSVTYTTNGTATITPDDGYDGLSSVDVSVNVASGGGGGGVEYEECVITIQGDFPADSFFAYTIPVMNPLGSVDIIPFLYYFYDAEPGGPMTIMKNSSIFIGGITRDCVAEGSIVAGQTGKDGYYSFWVTGDCKITF